MLNSGSFANEVVIALNEVIESRINDVYVSLETCNAWLADKLSSGVNYRLNDRIVILTGEEAGKLGYAVSLLMLDPEPKYLIELENGSDREYYESEIRPA